MSIRPRNPIGEPREGHPRQTVLPVEAEVLQTGGCRGVPPGKGGCGRCGRDVHSNGMLQDSRRERLWLSDLFPRPRPRVRLCPGTRPGRTAARFPKSDFDLYTNIYTHGFASEAFNTIFAD